MTLHQINHFPEQMTAGDVVGPANMLSFEEYETPEQAVRDIIRWFLDRDTVPVEPDNTVINPFSAHAHFAAEAAAWQSGYDTALWVLGVTDG